MFLKRIICLSVLLFCLGLVFNSAWAGTNPPTWKITQLDASVSPKSHLSVSGSKIVWEDRRAKNADIYLYDLETRKERAISSGSTWQTRPFIEGENVAWLELTSSSPRMENQICLLNLTTGQERKLTNVPGIKNNVSLYGNVVVWEDNRNGEKDIYAYDLNSAKEKRLTGKYDQESPIIWGNHVVWQQFPEPRSGYQSFLYLHDFTTGHSAKITEEPGNRPFITVAQGKVVWFEKVETGGYDLYIYDSNMGLIMRLFHVAGAIDVPTKQFFNGEEVIWLQYDKASWTYTLWHYDLSTGQKTALTKDKRDPFGLALEAEKVVWHNYEEWDQDTLYMAEAGTGRELLPPVIIVPGITASWSENFDIWRKKDPWLPLPKEGLSNWKPGFIASGNTLTNPYKKLKEALEEKGYMEGINLFVAAYDWRRSNSLTARDCLAPVVTEAQEAYARAAELPEGTKVKVDLIAHSMGGLVARSYIADYGGGEQVNRLIMLGTPNYGSPKAYFMWEGGHFAPSWKPNYTGADFLVDRVLQTLIDSYAEIDVVRPRILEKTDAFRQRLGEARVKAVKTYVPALGELMPVPKEGVDLSYLEGKTDYLIPLEIETLNYQNEFLKNLSQQATLEKLNRFTSVLNVRGSDPRELSSTRARIKVEAGEGELWTHGKPVEVNLCGQQKLLAKPEEEWFTGQGDGTVLWESALLPGSQNSMEAVKSGHASIPKDKDAWQQIFDFLDLPEDGTVEGTTEFLTERILYFSLNCPAELLVIDPLGRKIGFDQGTGTGVNELGETALYSGAGNEGQIIIISEPLPGPYLVKVIGQGTGHFLATFSAYDQNGYIQAADLEARGSLEKGKNLEYFLDYNPGLTESLQVGPRDNKPPTTGISIKGDKNAEGWYSQGVWVELFPLDDSEGDGVAETVYSLDEGSTWEVYQGPITFSKDGVYKLLFCSRDFADNLEEIREELIRLDCTTPDIKLPAISGPFYLNQPLTISYDVTDGLSGLAFVEATLNGQKILPGEVLLREAGENVLEVKAWDKAGNRQEARVQFEVSYFTRWLNPIGQGDFEPVYDTAANATVPVRFALFDYWGSMVKDDMISLLVKDADGKQLAEHSWRLPAKDTRINREGHYLANCRLKGLTSEDTKELYLEIRRGSIFLNGAKIKIK